MNRRGFLGTMLAACAAPAVVRAESLMRVKPIVLAGDAEFEGIAELLRMHNQVLEETMLFGRSALLVTYNGLWRPVRTGLPAPARRKLPGGVRPDWSPVQHVWVPNEK
jgi:hypothetical protein